MAVSNPKSRVISSGMKAEQWNQIESLLNQVLELPAAERSAFLDEHCANSDGLRAEIESLLSYEKESEKFLFSPAIAFSEGLFDKEKNQSEHLVGQPVGNFTIVGELGSGGMGAVYLAERRQAGIVQRAAIKMLRRELNTAEFRHRFDRERQILATLEHPNITRLFDTGTTDDGVPFFVMEYVEGTPINIFCRNLPLEATLKLFERVCETVAFAHHNLIVHRDLKPSNILITKDGAPKLLDFGISKLLASNPENTDGEVSSDAPLMTNFGALTPEYAAPEQLRGENITTASDIYSLGVILYELLTNQRPFNFERLNAPEMVQAVCQTEPEKPSAVITQANNLTGQQKYQPPTQPMVRNPKLLRGDLDNIVLTALQKEPGMRYGTVEKFAEDIERHLHKLPVRARPNTWTYRSQKFIKRHNYGMIAAAFIFLAIASSLALALWQAKNARRERDAANIEKLKTERINNFLQQMLSFSNQSVTSVSPVAVSKNVTVNEMLDEIAPEIETEFADAPDIRAQVLRTIGSSYASQGQYEKAEKYLRDSLQTQGNDEIDAESAATMLELGVLLYRRDKLDESGQVLEKAVAFYRKQQATGAAVFNPADLALALDYSGDVKFYQGDRKTAAAFLDEAFQIVSLPGFPADEHFVRTFIKEENGALAFLTGEAERGESLLRQAADEFRQDSGKPRWEFGNTLVFLGGIASAKNNLEEAEVFLIEGEQILRQTLGDKNVYVAGSLRTQASVLNRQGKYPEAEGKAQQALETYKEVLSGREQTYQMALSATTAILGTILTNEGRAREGEEYLREALTIYDAQPKKNFAAIVQSKIDLSRCLLSQKRSSEARAMAREAVAEAYENLGEQAPLLKLAADNLKKLV